MIAFSISCSMIAAVGGVLLYRSQISNKLTRRAVWQGIRMFLILGFLVACFRFGWLTGVGVMIGMLCISVAVVWLASQWLGRHHPPKFSLK